MKKGFTLVEIMIVVAIIALLAVIAIPGFMRVRASSQKSACINNLRQIEGAKDIYAQEMGLTSGAAITFAQIGPDTNSTLGGYMKYWPTCPASTNNALTNKTDATSGEDYNINAIDTSPTCKRVPEHRLPN